MTKVEIMALEGRALDAAIAERVCGWILVSDGLLMSPNGGVGVPRYSTDLNTCREAELAHPDRLAYGGWLLSLTGLSHVLLDVALIATIPADTRCRAMLLALEAK